MNDSEQGSGAAFTDGVGDNSHYLRTVISMTSRCCVLTQDAVYADNGIKLVDKGVRVDRQLYDRLVKHKLRGSIDDYLGTDDMVSVQSLASTAAAQCESDTLAYLLVHTLDGMAADRLLAPVRAMMLPTPLAFKLTVMREEHPALYAHSVRVMLVAVYLGLKSGWSERECVPLATAALLHDIGVLHMDPAWHDPANKITGAGRKQLVAHPVTAMLIIRSQNVYPRSVEQAVLEHHECMDGSGYPRGLRGEQISPMGQILLVAEVVAAFFEKYANEAAAQRLSLTLRLNHRKFPAALVGCLLPALNIRAVQSEMQATQGDVEHTIALLSGAFDDWAARSAALAAAAVPTPTPEPPSSASAFVEERLAALQKNLIEAGSHPRQQAEALQHLAGDPEGMGELALLGREALWQLESIVDATYSRWPRLADSSDAGDTAVAQWRAACAERLASDSHHGGE